MKSLFGSHDKVHRQREIELEIFEILMSQINYYRSIGRQVPNKDKDCRKTRSPQKEKETKKRK